MSVHQLFDVSVLFATGAAATRAYQAVFGATPENAKVTFGALNVLSTLSTTPMPAEGLDLRLEGALPLGEAYIGVKLGLLDAFTGRRTFGPSDAFAANGGRMREASRLVLALLDHGGHAVVLHKAAGTVKSAGRFRDQLRDVSNPEVRPFAAWLDFLASAEADGFQCRSYGLPHYFGRPNVSAVASGASDDTFTLERTMQAVQFACGRLAADPTLDEPPAAFEVPVAYRLGARSPSLPGAHDSTYRWDAATDDDGLMLTLRCAELPARHPARLWDANPAQVPLDVYRRALEELLQRRYAGDGFQGTDGLLYEAREGLPPIALEVFTRDDGVVLITTVGTGRSRAPAGLVEYATEHAEFLVVARADTPATRTALLNLAELSLITTAPGGLKDFDGFPPSPNGPNGLGLIIAPMNDLPLGSARPLAYRLFMPVTALEYVNYRTLDVEARRAWFAANAPSFAAIASRWPLPTAA